MNTDVLQSIGILILAIGLIITNRTIGLARKQIDTLRARIIHLERGSDAT